MFWTFNQNNSGGRFIMNDQVNEYVIIEAATRDEACDRAEDIGIYFNGCDAGRDCDCCGDRWSRPWNDEGSAAPSVYGKHPSEYPWSMRWGDNAAIIVYPLQGPKEIYYNTMPKRN